LLPLVGAPSLQVVSIEVPAEVVNGWVQDVVVVDWHLQGDASAHLAGIVREKGLARRHTTGAPTAFAPHMRAARRGPA
jgi:hypothetical protein